MATKRLYRSSHDRIIFGVCGGLGEYFDLDSNIVRIIFVILTFTGGVGIILYIVGLFLIPNDKLANNNQKNSSPEKIHEKFDAFASEIKTTLKKNPARLTPDKIFGLVILLIGLIYLFQLFLPWFSLTHLWPLILIILGIVILANN